MDNFYLIISSGLAGAIAGGVVSFVSQLFERKWRKEDNLRDLKISIYSEIISVAGEYLKEESFLRLNNLVSKALLLSRKPLHNSLIDYMKQTALLHKKRSENKIIQDRDHAENGLLHAKIVTLMKEELGI